jgi:hypothetical protein
MSRELVVLDGQDPITRPVLRYLQCLGVPARDIRRIEVDSEVGQPQLITVTIMVDTDRLAEL